MKFDDEDPDPRHPHAEVRAVMWMMIAAVVFVAVMGFLIRLFRAG